MANRAQRRQWSREINGGMTLLYTFNIVDIFVGGGGGRGGMVICGYSLLFLMCHIMDRRIKWLNICCIHKFHILWKAPTAITFHERQSY